MSSRMVGLWGRMTAAIVLAIFGAQGVAYGQGQVMNGGQGQGMQIQTASACGNQPRCYDAPTFAAVITDFRTSEANGFKVIDVVIRYFNKTNQPRALGYVDGSAAATDDQGNRYVLNWYAGNGIRGMGVVNGNNIDAKFVMQPGGAADAHYELLWRPGNAVAGVSYTLDLSIREINALEGRQFSLGSEAPLHFEGLVNNTGGNAGGAQGSGMQMGQGAPVQGAPVQGMQGGTVQDMSAQGAQGVAAANGAAPCDSTASASGLANTASTIASQTGSSPAANTAANTTTQAASAVSSLGSLFKHKQPANNTATNTASTNPCPAGSNVTGLANTASSTISGVQSGGYQNAMGTVSTANNTVASAYPGNAAYPSTTTTSAPMNASVPMALTTTGGNACAGRTHCFQSGPIAAEVTSILPSSATGPQDHVVRLNVTFHNLSNQPIALAYKSGSGHLQDEHGTGYYSARPGTHDASAAGIGLAEGRNVNSSFVLRPGESRNAAFQLDSFDRGSKPMGTSFNYSMVVEQLQVLPNGQVQPAGEYPLNFAGLTTGAANAVVPAVGRAPASNVATSSQSAVVPAAKSTPVSTATPVTAVPAVKTTTATAVPVVKTTPAVAVPAAKTTTPAAKKPATTTTTTPTTK
jgi:hypothetical protein